MLIPSQNTLQVSTENNAANRGQPWWIRAGLSCVSVVSGERVEWSISAPHVFHLPAASMGFLTCGLWRFHRERALEAQAQSRCAIASAALCCPKWVKRPAKIQRVEKSLCLLMCRASVSRDQDYVFRERKSTATFANSLRVTVAQNVSDCKVRCSCLGRAGGPWYYQVFEMLLQGESSSTWGSNMDWQKDNEL